MTTLEDALTAPPPDVVAHRVVHGGDRSGAVVVDDRVVEELTALTALAPLHQPQALAGVDRCRATWPDVPNVACFDTAFHATLPAAARTYALPAAPARDGARVRVPRSLPRVVGPARRDPRSGCAPRGRRTSGRRAVAVRGPGRTQRDDDDGLHAGRRARDGHAFGGGRPRCVALVGAAGPRRSRRCVGAAERARRALRDLRHARGPRACRRRRRRRDPRVRGVAPSGRRAPRQLRVHVERGRRPRVHRRRGRARRDRARRARPRPWPGSGSRSPTEPEPVATARSPAPTHGCVRSW